MLLPRLANGCREDARIAISCRWVTGVQAASAVSGLPAHPCHARTGLCCLRVVAGVSLPHAATRRRRAPVPCCHVSFVVVVWLEMMFGFV